MRCGSSNIDKFQSLSGFQVRCNKILYFSIHNPCNSFNPYRVFKFAATLLVAAFPDHFHKFQSLSGFQVRCNCRVRMYPCPHHSCFNPYRVFKFAATCSALFGPMPSQSFQSLSGFQVRCNFWSHHLQSFTQVVSIPIGFSSSLQHKQCRP